MQTAQRGPFVLLQSWITEDVRSAPLPRTICYLRNASLVVTLTALSFAIYETTLASADRLAWVLHLVALCLMSLVGAVRLQTGVILVSGVLCCLSGACWTPYMVFVLDGDRWLYLTGLALFFVFAGLLNVVLFTQLSLELAQR